MNGRSEVVKQDPFGNLTDWRPVLDLVVELSELSRLSECQPGLIRILNYRGGWRLREEVLKRVGQIKSPSEDLIYKVLAILGDDNIYFDARILANNALVKLLQNTQNGSRDQIAKAIREVVERLTAIPQPLYLEDALRHLCEEIGSRNSSHNQNKTTRFTEGAI